MCRSKTQKQQSLVNSQINVSLGKSETTLANAQGAVGREGQRAQQRTRELDPQYVMTTSMWPNDLKNRETQHMPADAEASMLPMYVLLKSGDEKNSARDLYEQQPSGHCQPSFQTQSQRLDTVPLCGPCAPPPGFEMLAPHFDTLTNRVVSVAPAAPKRRRTRQPVAGMHVGIRSKACAREECQVTSRKTGECYQICHARVTEVVPDGYVRVHYIDHELSDESLLWSDIQKRSDKDMRWCEHGRMCNRMVRSGNCDKQHDEMGCKRRFCHNAACADQERRAR